MANEWQHGLCGCFDNLGVCIITYIVPCYTYGKNAEAVNKSCLLHGLLFFIPCIDLICGAMVRGEVREQKGISGSFVGDLITFLCCPLCTIVQTAQEVGSIGGSMAVDQGEVISRN